MGIRHENRSTHRGRSNNVATVVAQVRDERHTVSVSSGLEGMSPIHVPFIFGRL